MTSSSGRPFETAAEFLAAAIAFELDSAAFYRDLGGRCTGTAAELMHLLERQETAHAAALRALALPHPDSVIAFPPDLSAGMPPSPAADASMPALLDHAIERERRAKEIYRHAALQVTGSFRDLIEGLARFEEEHEERLLSLRGM